MVRTTAVQESSPETRMEMRPRGDSLASASAGAGAGPGGGDGSRAAASPAPSSAAGGGASNASVASVASSRASESSANSSTGSALRTKILAFLGLFAIQTAVVVITKAAQARSGGYSFNPSAALAMAECVKFMLSTSFRTRECIQEANEHPSGNSAARGGLRGAFALMVDGFLSVPRHLVFGLVFLALCYAVNNQLTFVILQGTDPATLTLGKSATPFLTAIGNWMLFDEPLNRLQWACVVMQVCGLIIVLYDVCGAGARASASSVVYLVIAVLITSITSVVNARFLKKENVSMHVQNMILYSSGVVFNALLFVFGLTPSAQEAFLGGFDHPAAILVVVCNAFIGLAINFVYKYGDAIIKTFAASASSAMLLYLGAAFFDAPITVVQACGSVVIFCVCYCYFILAPKHNDEFAKSGSGGEEEDNHSAGRSRHLARWRKVTVALLLFGVTALISWQAALSDSEMFYEQPDGPASTTASSGSPESDGRAEAARRLLRGVVGEWND